MKKVVYALTSGTYSDYRIVAMFTTLEKLEEYKAAVPNDGYNDPEAYELDPDTAVLLKAGYHTYRVLMLRDGDTEQVDRRDDLVGPIYRPDIWRRSAALAYRGKGVKDCLDAVVLAKDTTHAVKIANEIRARMIADGQWEES